MGGSLLPLPGPCRPRLPLPAQADSMSALSLSMTSSVAATTHCVLDEATRARDHFPEIFPNQSKRPAHLPAV